jgi:hypothetical protein
MYHASCCAGHLPQCPAPATSDALQVVHACMHASISSTSVHKALVTSGKAIGDMHRPAALAQWAGSPSSISSLMCSTSMHAFLETHVNMCPDLHALQGTRDTRPGHVVQQLEQLEQLQCLELVNVPAECSTGVPRDHVVLQIKKMEQLRSLVLRAVHLTATQVRNALDCGIGRTSVCVWGGGGHAGLRSEAPLWYQQSERHHVPWPAWESCPSRGRSVTDDRGLMRACQAAHVGSCLLYDACFLLHA